MERIEPIQGTIMALDPGVTTGAALWTPEGTLFAWQIFSPEKPFSKIWKDLTYYRPETLVVESFNYQRRDKVDLSPMAVIGCIHTWNQVASPASKVVHQSPAQAKVFWTDDKLKKMVEWQVGEPHANDAKRHLFYYMTKIGDKRWINQLKPEER